MILRWRLRVRGRRSSRRRRSSLGSRCQAGKIPFRARLIAWTATTAHRSTIGKRISATEVPTVQPTAENIDFGSSPGRKKKANEKERNGGGAFQGFIRRPGSTSTSSSKRTQAVAAILFTLFVARFLYLWLFSGAWSSNRKKETLSNPPTVVCFKDGFEHGVKNSGHCPV